MSTQPALFPLTPKPAPTSPKITHSLKERAILVDFDGGYWDWTRRDRRVEADVATRSSVNKSAGRYLKNLFLSADTPLEAIRTTIQRARQLHTSMTLPWAPSRNLLLNINYLSYKTQQTRAAVALDQAKATLSQRWASMLSQAASALGPLHDPSDYPDLSSVLSSCYIAYRYYPLADETDIRLVADADTVSEIRAQVRAEQATTYAKAVASSWERLLTIMESAVANLAKTGQKGERYRSEWHDNLASLVPLLAGLNLDGDPRLDALSSRASALLRPDPEEYSVSLSARASALTKAQSIYSDLASIYSTLPSSSPR